MIWLFVVIGALAVFAVAAAFVGREAFRLGHTPTTAIFDLDEAVTAVADGLSEEDAAGLTYDEVRQLLLFALDHFRAKGVSVRPGEDFGPVEATADVVIADDDAVAVVLGRADEAGLVVTDTAVLAVLDLLLDHLADIGALGPSA